MNEEFLDIFHNLICNSEYFKDVDSYSLCTDRTSCGESPDGVSIVIIPYGLPFSVVTI